MTPMCQHVDTFIVNHDSQHGCEAIKTRLAAMPAPLAALVLACGSIVFYKIA